MVIPVAQLQYVWTWSVDKFLLVIETLYIVGR